MTEIGARASIKSIIITAYLGFDKWDQIFTDKVIAAAIVDRLTFKAFIIDMVTFSGLLHPYLSLFLRLVARFVGRHLLCKHSLRCVFR